MAVESILEGVRNYLAECPVLDDLFKKNRHIDWTKAEGDNYGIYCDGDTPIGKPYINGNQNMQYSVSIKIRKMADSDAKRLEANAFLERLQRYFFDQTKAKNFPEMPENCEATGIEAVNAMLLDLDVTGKKGTYIVQINLNYTLYNR